MVSSTVITLIQRAILQGIPILYGSTGEILTEKSGNLNLGIPGIMYVGGISGVIGAFLYEESVKGGEMNGFGSNVRTGVWAEQLPQNDKAARRVRSMCFMILMLSASQRPTR